MLESTITNNIRKYLATVPGLFFWKTHGAQFGKAGIPDIIICYHGKFIALEVKASGRMPTALQSNTIGKIRKAGGIAYVVYSLREVQEIIAVHGGAPCKT